MFSCIMMYVTPSNISPYSIILPVLKQIYLSKNIIQMKMIANRIKQLKLRFSAKDIATISEQNKSITQVND